MGEKPQKIQEQKQISLGVLAHVDAGKTTLSEGLLLNAEGSGRSDVWIIKTHIWIRMNWNGNEALPFFPNRQFFPWEIWK